jgi:hypothetical protein
VLSSALLALGITVSACQQPATVNTNANVANANVAGANGETAANANVSAVVPASAVINTREPERYRATVVISAQTAGGDQASALPQLTAEVARDGANRRVAFKLPNGEPLIYLDRTDKRYVILPNRKQYGDLTAEATGFDVQHLMTPGQLVAFLQKQPGYERVGDEQVNGRMAEKYRYATTAKTGTQAGDVNSETYVYVDKDTGLPLRSEMLSQTSGNVQGVKALKVITEMRDIQTDVDPRAFEIPQGFSQVPPEQIRQQFQLITSAVSALVGNLLQTMSTGGQTTSVTTTTTAASPTPTATVQSSPSPTAP